MPERAQITLLRKWQYKISDAIVSRWPFRKRWDNLRGEGQCGSCGFLGNRETPPPPEGEMFHEVSQAQRTTGYITTYVSQARGHGYVCALHCFINEADLYHELKRKAPDEEAKEEFSRETYLAIIHRADRHCPAWIPYQQSYGPKWHLEQRLIQVAQQAANRTQRTLAGIALFQAIVSVGALAAVVLFNDSGSSTTNQYFGPPVNTASESVVTPTPSVVD